MSIVKFVAPRHAAEIYPDSDRYKGGFGVRSASSDRIYKISYDCAAGAMYWKCSCPGNIRHGQCKHLDACGLKGRKYGANRNEAKKFGFV